LLEALLPYGSYWPVHAPPAPGDSTPGRDLRHPIEARRCTVQLSTGRLYLDAVASSATALLGHDVPPVPDADLATVTRLLSLLAPGYGCLAIRSTYEAASKYAAELDHWLGLAKPPHVVQVNAIVGEPDVTCDMLIVHENETLGRTGKWLASAGWKRSPDFVVVGDALAMGFPFGAVLGRFPRPNDHVNEPDAATLARVAAVIRAVENEGLLKQGQEVAEYLMARLAAVRETCPEIENIEGQGLSIRILLAPAISAAQIRRRMCERGVLVGVDDAGYLAIEPPLALRVAEADVITGALRGALLDLPMVSASPCCAACEAVS
jgi:acetylornithine/succinyldiaminopimelate/putrescine aminotransferase